MLRNPSHILLFILSVMPSIAAAEREVAEVVVVATRNAQSTESLPYATDLISRQELNRKLVRSLPQAFRDTPGIMVQETSFGQGSPFIRGFTGFRNVLLIDGVRMNNSTLRDGPNQYWATVDHLGLDRIEALNGSAATLYGSDAVGGIVNAVTPDPFSADSRLHIRTASAEESLVGRFEIQSDIGEANAVWMGVTRKYFGNLHGGDIGTQRGTGYDERGFDLKWSSQLDNDWRLDTLAQQFKQINVPRTHRTVLAKSWHGTDVGSDKKRDLDQTRKLAYLRLTSPPMSGLVDNATFTLSTSQMEEERDRIRSNDTRDFQGFDVTTLGATAQFSSASPIGQLIYGIDYYRDEVDSFSSRNSIQGPMADDAQYQSLDVFLQHQMTLSERLGLVAGVRHTRATMDANRVMHPVSRQQITVDDDWHATVFNVRASYHLLQENLILYAGLAEAFRAPNLSDMTRFDSSRSDEFEIPSLGLDSEKFLSYEAGFKWTGDRSYLSAAFFRTRIDGQIERFPTGRVVDGEMEITKANIGDGWVQGAELSLDHRLSSDITMFSTLTWMDGEVDTFPTAAPILVREPISRLMPMTGSLGLRWKKFDDPLWAEVVLRSARHQHRLSTRDAADTSRIPPGGTPGYVVFNMSAGYQFSEKLQATFAIDNVGDIDYRVHGSGTNMPGLNFLLALEISLQ
jgi:hemoglobin/transferrin/lactoferrin receptor protein